ncbi:alginate O-acetyltransferase AlgX-related protein [Microbulbifer celer]|uniref:AlgX/AlgJ SGNH hydrolase-like domain-containing protein n=1 Tax=Microbulbifer celer TaxID=435905 RepID=A0ABW3U7N5_9GAMM|nr:hypothetical protein [Microbulbifer celer]UFN57876.1 hypothetical protein LPW13_02185 [Microbulbifer celer]
MYQISIVQHSMNTSEVSRWCLDFPRQGQACTVDSLSDGLVFQGWVLVKDGAEAVPYLKLNGEKHYLPLNCQRADVITKVLGESADGHAQLTCGFRHTFALKQDSGVFGFEVGGTDFDAASYRIEGSLRILEGDEGWLYLDNDTNESVEQYQGNLLLDKNALKEWKSYLSAFTSLALEQNIRHTLLIAPSKEMVLPEFYPHEKGRTSPVEQVAGLSKPEHKLVYPVSQMRAMQEQPFRKCDTHWSPKGALVGFKAALEALGLDMEAVDRVFESDVYQESVRGGDLGNKLYPPRRAPEWLLTKVRYQKWVVYDNHLPNLGRVIVFLNEGALLNTKCVIFGSSSSYSFFNYAARIFSTLIFVHSAGSIDAGLLEIEKPEYVLAQTNGRFVVRAPVVTYDLEAEMDAKLDLLSDTQLKDLRKKHQAACSLPDGCLNFDIPSVFSCLLTTKV